MNIVKESKWQRIRYMIAAPLGEGRKYLTACDEHIALSRSAAREGMVLLKNEGGLLPFSRDTKLAVFGKACFDYVPGGGGSGYVRPPYIRNLMDGLDEKQVQTFAPLREYYAAYVAGRYAEGVRTGLVAEPELPEELVQQARAFTDTAVITVSRFSGENIDRSGAKEDGDFYLSAMEQAMVKKVLAAFDKVAVVLNTGGMMDTLWFKDEPKIRSALLAWQGGMEGGCAMADILLGDESPSGRLTDTFAVDFDAYPSSETYNESAMYVEYQEDIYVGYRYFETVPGAAQKVCYPFGYGLSYTEFALSELCRDGLTFTARVTNVGSRAGREVVQLYCAPPQGRLDKPARVLVGFAKTETLQPWQSQIVTISVPVKYLASYDDTGLIAENAWVLEKGSYAFHLGSNVRQTQPVPGEYRLEEDLVLEQCGARCVPHNLTRRLHADGSYETYDVPKEDRAPWVRDPLIPADAYEMPPRECPWPPYRDPRKTFGYHQLIDVYQGKATLDQLMGQMTDEHLVHLLGGQPNRGPGNTFGWGNLALFGIPNAMTADGPAGLRFYADIAVKTTSFPCANQLACTWNRQIMYDVGAAVATEVRENGLGIWLSPAVNIHRSPLCGRNFEYMSEDPLVSGLMASSMIAGVQSMGVAACLKHFACNNKEVNRDDCNSILSQRALREIYLRAFEICVREGEQPWAIMSSYNLINGVRASSCRELLTDILRSEWGFEGLVTTDWFNNEYQYREIAAGGDVKMAAGMPDHTLQMLREGKLSIEDVRTSAKRVLELLLKLA